MCNKQLKLSGTHKGHVFAYKRGKCCKTATKTNRKQKIQISIRDMSPFKKTEKYPDNKTTCNINKQCTDRKFTLSSVLNYSRDKIAKCTTCKTAYPHKQHRSNHMIFIKFQQGSSALTKSTAV